ncbi:CYP46A1 isoform 4, partial [Pongo abelii]
PAREEEAAPGGPGEHSLPAPGGQGLGPAPPGGPEEGRGGSCRHPHTDSQS